MCSSYVDLLSNVIQKKRQTLSNNPTKFVCRMTEWHLGKFFPEQFSPDNCPGKSCPGKSCQGKNCSGKNWPDKTAAYREQFINHKFIATPEQISEHSQSRCKALANKKKKWKTIWIRATGSNYGYLIPLTGFLILYRRQVSPFRIL
jgi:hypothetical protein